MEYVKDLPAKYLYNNYHVGVINVPDGKIDITDPGYDHDTWCAIFDKDIKSGKYYCYVDIVNFPSIYKAEHGDYDVLAGDHKDGEEYICEDPRIMALRIVHEDYVNAIGNKRWKLVDNNIGVDAGMCGFYNHKPDFKDDEWNDFWQSLEDFPDMKWRTCDCNKANGVTVSSGFGDGCYSCYQMTDNKLPIALELRFD